MPGTFRNAAVNRDSRLLPSQTLYSCEERKTVSEGGEGGMREREREKMRERRRREG